MKLAGRAIWLLLGIAVSLTYVLHRAEGNTDTWQPGGRAVKAINEAWKARSALLQARATSAYQQAQVSQQGLNALYARLDSIHTQSTDSTPVVRALETTCRHIIMACELRSHQLEQALSLTSARADTTAANLAVADSTLQIALKQSQCHVWFLPCPSRQMAFVVGGVFGVAGTVLVRR